MPPTPLPAVELQEARERLEAHLREALSGHVLQEDLAFDLNLEDNTVTGEADLSEKQRALRRIVRTCVEAFHTADIVRQTGVRVYKVTAIDSDSDGRVAVNVKYEYPADAGMSPEHIGDTTAAHLPASSAGEAR